MYVYRTANLNISKRRINAKQVALPVIVLWDVVASVVVDPGAVISSVLLWFGGRGDFMEHPKRLLGIRNSNSADAEQLSRICRWQMDRSVSHISIGAPLYVYKTENMNIAMRKGRYVR